MKICPKCNHENRDTSKFCEECGEKLVSSPKFCPECGTPLEGSPKFCPECGYNFVTGEPSSYQEDDEPDELDIQEKIIGTYSYDSEELAMSFTFRNDNSLSMSITVEGDTSIINGIYELDDYDVSISGEEDSDDQGNFTGTFSSDGSELTLKIDGIDVVLTKGEDYFGNADDYEEYDDDDDDSSYEEYVDEISYFCRFPVLSACFAQCSVGRRFAAWRRDGEKD